LHPQHQGQHGEHNHDNYRKTAADILNEETQTRAVARLQEYLGDMGIHEDYNQIETDAINIAQKMFDDINKEKFE
jgi:methionine synthase I (cobalamin-dependent)